MPAPQPILASLKNYLRTDFALFKPWLLPQESDGSVTKIIVEHAQVKSALRKLALTDPALNRILEYLWRTTRSREDIASSEGVDPSTVKRRWDKGLLIVLNWIFNGDVSTDDELPPVDLLARDLYNPGDSMLDIMESYRRAVKAGKIPRLSSTSKDKDVVPLVAQSQRLPGR
jgi:hypothetical protein